MKKTSEILNLIKITLRNYITDAEVNLFGSRAKNNADFDSDYDILIVTEKEWNITPVQSVFMPNRLARSS